MAKKIMKAGLVAFLSELKKDKKEFGKQLAAVRKDYPLVAAVFTFYEQAFFDLVKWKGIIGSFRRLEDDMPATDIVRAKAMIECTKNGGTWEGGKCYRTSLDR